MSAETHKTYPKPAGELPQGRCPLCKSPEGIAHKSRCPWLLWATWPADHSGHKTARGEL